MSPTIFPATHERPRTRTRPAYGAFVPRGYRNGYPYPYRSLWAGLWAFLGGCGRPGGGVVGAGRCVYTSIQCTGGCCMATRKSSMRRSEEYKLASKRISRTDNGSSTPAWPEKYPGELSVLHPPGSRGGRSCCEERTYDALLSVVQENPGSTAEELAIVLLRSPMTLRRTLNMLEKEGVIESREDRSGRNTRTVRRWWPT